jgi:hypothetical protein
LAAIEISIRGQKAMVQEQADGLYHCGRHACSHYVEQPGLGFAGAGAAVRICGLVGVSPGTTCVAYGLEGALALSDRVKQKKREAPSPLPVAVALRRLGATRVQLGEGRGSCAVQELEGLPVLDIRCRVVGDVLEHADREGHEVVCCITECEVANA